MKLSGVDSGAESGVRHGTTWMPPGRRFGSLKRSEMAKRGKWLRRERSVSNRA